MTGNRFRQLAPSDTTATGHKDVPPPRPEWHNTKVAARVPSRHQHRRSQLAAN
jgi:hypothetical protein